MNKKSFGFTLIELLVVIAIISLLSSVVLAALRDVRDKAEQTAYREYMSEVIKAIEISRTQNDISTLFLIDVNIDNTFLGTYIQKNKQPSFDDAGTPLTFNWVANNPDYTCEDDVDSDYFILFASTRDDLNFRKMYYLGAQYIDNFYWYCSSPTLR